MSRQLSVKEISGSSGDQVKRCESDVPSDADVYSIGRPHIALQGEDRVVDRATC